MIAEQDYVKQNVKCNLPVELDDAEIASIAKERAKAETRKAEDEQKFVDIKKEWVEKIAMQERNIETMGADIARGKQDRPVLCDEIFRAGQIVTIRRDTGAVCGSRPASMQEAQRHLPAQIGGTPGALDAAAQAQKDNASEENDDGDVVPPEDDQPKKRKKK